MKKSKIYLILVIILAILAALFVYIRVPETKDLSISKYFNDVSVNRDLNSEVEIKARYDNKIVYNSNIDKEIAQRDCSKRQGFFNECGSACGKDADTCIELCTYTCEFEDKFTDVKESEINKINWQEYYSEDFELSLEYMPTMTLEKNQDGSISFVYLGSTQERGTEIYDGIIFSVNRVDNIDNLDLRKYTEDNFSSNKIATVSQEIEEYNLNSLSGYSYKLISAGSETTYLYLSIDNNSVLELRYSASGPKGNDYMEIVNYMLNSIEIRNSIN